MIISPSFFSFLNKNDNDNNNNNNNNDNNNNNNNNNNIFPDVFGSVLGSDDSRIHHESSIKRHSKSYGQTYVDARALQRLHTERVNERCDSCAVALKTSPNLSPTSYETLHVSVEH